MQQLARPLLRWLLLMLLLLPMKKEATRRANKVAVALNEYIENYPNWLRHID